MKYRTQISMRRLGEPNLGFTGVRACFESHR